MQTKLWQATQRTLEGTTLRRETFELPADYTEGNVRMALWMRRHWCRGGHAFSAYVKLDQIAPEDRQPDIETEEFRGDMSASATFYGVAR